MARKAFKIVNNLDLSGNKLIDVSTIYRSDYDKATPGLNLTIRAGNDALGGTSNTGGHLNLYSGFGASGAGKISIFVPTGPQTVVDGEPDVTGKYGLEFLGSTAATLRTNNQDIAVYSGTGAIKLIPANTSYVHVQSTLNGATTSKSLRLAGGLSVGEDIYTTGDYFDSSQATYYLLDSTVTTLNLGGAATTLNLGYDGSTLASTTNINTGAVSAAVTKTVNIATGGVGSSSTNVNIGSIVGSGAINLHNKAINLGTSTAAASTVSVGGAISGNTLQVVSTAGGIANIDTSVTTGTVNLFSGVTSGRVNIALNNTNGSVYIGRGALSTIYLGGQDSTVVFGSSADDATLVTGAGVLAVNVFNTVATTVNAFGEATSVTLGAASGSLDIRNLTVSLSNATSLQGTKLNTIDLATTAAATINIGTGGTTGGTTAITIGSTIGSTTTLNGSLVLGDGQEETITINGTISSGGIKIFDSDSTTYRYTLLPGNIAANTTLTLPTTSGQYFALSDRADGLIDMTTIMAGSGSTALVPSAGGVIWSDADGFQVLAGTTAGKALISGNAATPSWSTGTLSLSTNLAVDTGSVTLSGYSAGSTLVLPSGRLTLPQLGVAGDILYASSTTAVGVITPVAPGSLLASAGRGIKPAWSATPTITGITLSGATGALVFSGATSADIDSNTAVTANIFGTTVSTINIGGAVANTTLNLLGSTETGVVNVNSTKASSMYADGALVVAGGVGIAGAVFTNSSMTLAGDLAVNGADITSTATTFNFMNATVTTLNMLGAASIMNVGASSDTLARTVNLYGDVNVGCTDKLRTMNMYGAMNFMASTGTGFRVEYNDTDASLDFIKN
jgi:hypothetical protein